MKTIDELLRGGANITLSIGAQELRSVFAETIRDERKRIEEEILEKSDKTKANLLLSRDEVCSMLKVSHTTLWDWNKRGYLKALKTGGRVLYRQSDIESILHKVEGSQR